MGNPFEDMEKETTRHRRKKMQRQEKFTSTKAPMVPTRAEKAVYEQREQLRQFQRWKREIRAGLITGEYAPEIIGLLRLLRKVPEPESLVRFVRNSQWLLEGSLTMRTACFEYIDTSISRWRVRNGLAPFDDGLPGEPDSPFVQVRQMLTRTDDAHVKGNTSGLGMGGGMAGVGCPSDSDETQTAGGEPPSIEPGAETVSRTKRKKLC